MPDIQLILTDLDGTLLLKDHASISPRTRAALLAAKTQGAKLCICTGRCLGLLPPAVLEPGLFDYAITSNGGACMDLHTEQDVFTMPLSAEKAALAWSILQPMDLMVEWFVNNGLLLDRHNYSRWRERVRAPWHVTYLEAGRATVVEQIEDFFAQGAPKLEKISVMHISRTEMERLVPQLDATGAFTWPGSLGDNLEITDRETTKAAGMLRLCQELGLSAAQSLAFGDGWNDVPMLTQAGIGVAMANSQPQALAAADFVTCSNMEDGVGIYIEDHVLR